MNPSPVILPGHFALLSELGRGTTGVVYKAQDGRLNRIVAIKTLLPCPETERIERLTQFFREFQATASLQHQHIVALLEANEFEGYAYLVREYVEGSTLEALAAAKSIDLRTGFRLLRQVCEAIGAVHARGFAHHNLTLSNVLVASTNGSHRAKLIGFGQVGTLAGASVAPADVQSLYQMLHCLAGALGQPLPAELVALDVATPAAFAAALRRHV